MNGSPLTPTLVVAHDEIAGLSLERILRLRPESPEHLIASSVEALDVADLRTLMSEVGADDPFLLVHLLGPLGKHEEAVDPLVEEITAVRNRIEAEYPALRGMRQWVIHAVGSDMEADEQSLLRRLLDTGRLRGALVTATSSKASVAHELADQATFSADAALLLSVPQLEAQLAVDPPAAWGFGVASISYSSVRLGEAVSAHHASKVLEAKLLTTPDARDPAHDIGEAFIESLELTSDGERNQLLKGPRGGSLLARVRLDDVKFEEVPVLSWADTIVTRHDIISLRELPFVTKRIAANGQDRLRDLKDSVVRQLLDELESLRNFESGLRFCEGMRSKLEVIIGEMRAKQTSVATYDTASERQKLRQLLRWLPFGPAVAVRLVAIALLVLIATAALGTTDSNDSLPQLTASPWPISATAATIGLGVALYGRRLRKTIRVRDRLAHRLGQLLVDHVESQVWEQRIAILSDLYDWIGPRFEPTVGVDMSPPREASTLSKWLTWTQFQGQKALDELEHRSENRALPGVGGTPYAIELPAPADIDTKELSDVLLGSAAPSPEETAASLIVSLRSLVSAESLPVLEYEQLAGRWSEFLKARVTGSAWGDLTELLEDAPSARSRARNVLETDVTPALNQSEALVRHYLMVPGGKGGTLARALLESDENVSRGVSSRLTDTHDMPLDSVAAMVHLSRINLGEPEKTGRS